MAAVKVTFQCNSRAKVFDKVFGMDSADCCFQFIDETTKTVNGLKAHKQVLAAISTVFAAMFSGNWKENANPITIVDASYESFEKFMEFFYKDQVELTEDNVGEILHLAHKYNVEDLVSNCESFMITSLSVHNVLGYYSGAVRFGRHSLQVECKNLFSRSPERILRLPSFPECDAKTLATFLPNVPQSYEAAKVFDACITWAKQKCQQNGRDETNMMNLRNELGDCFRIIRFEQMSFEAMASRFAPYISLFTKDESDDILKNLFKNVSSRHYLKRLSGMKLEFNGCYDDTEADVHETMSLKVSRSLIMHAITAAEFWCSNILIPFSAKITVCNGNKNIFERIAHFKKNEMKFVFPKRIEIKAGAVHQIQLLLIYVDDPQIAIGGYVYKRQQLAGVDIIPIDAGTEGEASGNTQYAIESLEFIIPDD